jgi:hypothetical protein
MKRWIVLASLAVLTTLPACSASSAGGPAATSLRLARELFPDPQVIVATSMPPQFEVVFDREMPTPGWQFVIDSVEVDRSTRRIVASVSDIPPEGPTAQVITRTPCRVPLGHLETGHYLLEVHLRRGRTGAHTLAQAFVLVAR